MKNEKEIAYEDMLLTKELSWIEFCDNKIIGVVREDVALVHLLNAGNIEKQFIESKMNKMRGETNRKRNTNPNGGKNSKTQRKVQKRSDAPSPLPT